MPTKRHSQRHDELSVSVSVGVSVTTVCCVCCTAGYECDIYDNPPDFFLDVVNGDSSAVKCNTGWCVPVLFVSCDSVHGAASCQ